MIEYGFILIALFAVMIIPGPTNALLASSAQQIGMQKSLRLIPAELIGYMYAMALWWLIVAFTDDIWPLFIDILHFASAIYVFWLAFRLWKMKHLHAHSQRNKNIKAMQLFYSTFKNPKAVLRGNIPTRNVEQCRKLCHQHVASQCSVDSFCFVLDVLRQSLTDGSLQRHQPRATLP